MILATSAALVLLGVLLGLGLARPLGGGRRLATILLGVFGLRVLLATALYLISAADLPILRSLHLPGGFWQFAPDAEMYHANGLRIAAALAADAPLPAITTMVGGRVSGPTDFFYYVAVLYRLLGPGPLHVPLINASLGVATAAVAYALVRRHGDRRAAEVAALLVGFWPSGVLWSSQILKDSLVTCLMLVSLDLVLRAWEARRAAVLLPAGALVASVALLARNRPHVAAALTAAVGLALLGGALVGARAIRLGQIGRGAVLVLLLAAPVVAVRVAPWQPDLPSVGPRDGLATAPPGSGPEGASRSPALPTSLSRRAGDVVGRIRQAGRVVLDPVPSLDRLRLALVQSGGSSLVAADTRFTGGLDVLAFLPRALAYALYYPPPWQWVGSRQTGGFKALAGIEALAVLALTPLLLLAVWDAVRAPRLDAWVLLLAGTLLLASLALAIPNGGTLFRLRLQALMPLLILVAGRASRLPVVRRMMRA